MPYTVTRKVVSEHEWHFYSKKKLTHLRIEAASTGEPLENTEVMSAVMVSAGMASAVLDPMAPVQSSLLRAVLDIPGVDSALVLPYELRVIKAVAWEWEDGISKSILVLLTSFNLDLEKCNLQGEYGKRQKEEKR